MMKRENEVTQSCPTLCNPMDCSPPGSSVHGDSPGNNTGLLFPTPGDLPNPGIKTASLMSPYWASLVAQSITNLPAMQDTWVRFLGQEDPLEKEMADHSSILAWRIPWTEEPGRLQSMGSQESDTS